MKFSFVTKQFKRKEKVASLDLRGGTFTSLEKKEDTDKKETDWSSAEAEVESFAVAFATWQIPEIKDNEENIPLYDIFMKYHKDIAGKQQ